MLAVFSTYGFSKRGVNNKDQQIITFDILLIGYKNGKFSILERRAAMEFIEINQFYSKTKNVIDDDTFK